MPERAAEGNESLEHGSVFSSLSVNFGPFVVLEPLGDGGLAEVYLAKKTDAPENVALKILKPTALADNSSEARFVQEYGCGHLQREFSIARHFNHPNVLNVLEIGEVEGTGYLVTEAFSPVTFSNFVHEQRWAELVQPLE